MSFWRENCARCRRRGKGEVSVVAVSKGAKPSGSDPEDIRRLREALEAWHTPASLVRRARRDAGLDWLKGHSTLEAVERFLEGMSGELGLRIERADIRRLAERICVEAGLNDNRVPGGQALRSPNKAKGIPTRVVGLRIRDRDPWIPEFGEPHTAYYENIEEAKKAARMFPRDQYDLAIVIEERTANGWEVVETMEVDRWHTTWATTGCAGRPTSATGRNTPSTTT